MGHGVGRGFAEAVAAVSVTLWVGGMWTIGYLVTPTLFATLDNRMLAGNIAGQLFAVIAWIGMAVACYLLAFMALREGRAAVRRKLFWVAAAMLVCVAAGYFGIQTAMAELKASAASLDVMDSALRERFATLHGVSSAIYLLQSALGVWLVAGVRRL
jgi:small-conductance mechanosensitive channel